jgi:hypothetical protein
MEILLEVAAYVKPWAPAETPAKRRPAELSEAFYLVFLFH